jgi:hypothetical protein
VRVLEDVSAGDWLRPRLQGWGVVGGVVPRGYEAVARVLHPAHLSRLLGDGPDGLDVETRPVSWREVAARLGRTMHPLVQWGSLTGERDAQRPWHDGWLLNCPDEGTLPRAALEALGALLVDRAAPVRWTAALWIGWGELRSDGMPYLAVGTNAERPGRTRPGPLARAAAAAEARGRLLRLPGREHVVIDMEPHDLLGGAWFRDLAPEAPAMPVALTPNLLWPEDRSWCLATEIDFDSTLVAGDRGLIDAVLAHPGLEAVEVGYDDDLTWAGDRLNPSPSA